VHGGAVDETWIEAANNELATGPHEALLAVARARAKPDDMEYAEQYGWAEWLLFEEWISGVYDPPPLVSLKTAQDAIASMVEANSKGNGSLH
jgi:hypothetical protein